MVIAWEVYETARGTMSVPEASFAVGMIGLVQFLPLFALTLVAGEAADRHDRRKLLALCLVAQLLTAAALAARSHLGGGLWPIFVLAALFGCARAFAMPTASALGPMLVPVHLLPRAIATNVLVYMGRQQLGLAFTNIASMLRDGGYFIHNEIRDDVEELGAATSMPVTDARMIRLLSNGRSSKCRPMPTCNTPTILMPPRTTPTPC